MPMRVDECGLPRISLLGDSVNRANYCNPLALSVSFWPVSKGYNSSTRHKQRSEKETTWAGRAAAKTRTKGPWTQQSARPKRLLELLPVTRKRRLKGRWTQQREGPKRLPGLLPATRKRRLKDARSKRRARLRISWARLRTYSSSPTKEGGMRAGV